MVVKRMMMLACLRCSSIQQFKVAQILDNGEEFYFRNIYFCFYFNSKTIAADVSMIQTWIVRVEDEHADHLAITTTTAAIIVYF